MLTPVWVNTIHSQEQGRGAVGDQEQLEQAWNYNFGSEHGRMFFGPMFLAKGNQTNHL